MKLKKEVLARLSSVVRAETSSFVALAELAGFDPATGFRGADLRGVDFGEDDLRGFDFPSCSLQGAKLDRAKGVRAAMFRGAEWDETTRFPSGLDLPARSSSPPRMSASASPADMARLRELDANPDDLLRLSQRVPPQSPQAEQALLGALLANNKAYEQVSEFLAPEHFADPVHGRIFRAIQRRIEAGQLADISTLRPEFENSGELQEVGGPAYLAQLLSAMVGIINAGEYGRLIYDCWLRRQLMDVGEEVVNRAFSAEAELSAKEQLEVAEQRLFELDGRRRRGQLRHLRARAGRRGAERGARLLHAGGVSGLPSGLRDLDAGPAACTRPTW